MDYTETKVDFYTDYNGTNYQSFYEDEVRMACEVISSNGASNLLDKIKEISAVINNMQLEWYDSVEKEFENFIESTVDSLTTIESSISEKFISEGEKTYKKLETCLKNLKTKNNDYSNEFDSPPPKIYETINIGTIENPVKKIQLTSQYYSNLADWKERVNDYANQCIDLISEIETHKSTLKTINKKVITIDGKNPMIDTSLLNFEIPEPSYLDMEGIIDDYILANGLSLASYSRWGEEFYTLENITRADKQRYDKCLGYANGYAINLLNNKKTSYQNMPIMYSSKDSQEILEIAASEILLGRPVVLEVTGKHLNGSVAVPVIKNGVSTTETVSQWERHYVMAYGIRKGADLSNLQESDILYLDPAGGEVKQLGTNNGGSQRRDLLNAQAATYKTDDEFYCVNVFSSDIDYSEFSETCDKIDGKTQTIYKTPEVYYA